MMRAAITGNPDVPLSRTAAFAIYLAAALIIYLPLEVAVLAVLPQLLYWPLRLLPDGLIVVVAAAGLLDRALTTPARLALLGLGVVCAGILVANVARGFGWVDGVNALRVLVRYIPLGILLWGYAPTFPGAGSLLLRALLISGAIQIGAGVAGLVVDAVVSAPSTRIEALFLEDGTTGRYDRFGLFMALVVLGALASTHLSRHLPVVLAGLALILLAFSTSRQAMVAVAVGAVVIAVMPRLRRRVRLAAAAVVVVAITMPLYILTFAVAPSLDEDGPEAPGAGNPPIVRRGSSSVSTDPNENFRLFLSVDLAPWAAAQEPLLGFGPRQHVAEDPDPRLERYVRAAGTTWDWARRFTNDSNFASMVIQFGPVVTAAVVGLIGILFLLVFRRAWTTGQPIHVLAAAITVAVGAAAFLGPALEMRVTSLVLWVVLMTAVGTRRRHGS